MKVTSLVFTLLLLCICVRAQSNAEWRSWNQPVEPFRVVGNIYYVGANEITSFLITSPQGHILLDGGFVETAPQIRDNIRKLGFKAEDVKYLLNSQAHSDHAGGLAQLKQWTGAKFVVSREDGVQTERGGKRDFAWADTMQFPPVKTDQIIGDGEMLKLGGVVVTAHVTPGHTKGCTTWTMQADEDGHHYNVVFLCSVSAPGYRLVNNPNYPNIIEDYGKTFQVLKGLPCDVMLASHGSFFNLTGKRELLAKAPGKNPFVDPAEYQAYLDRAQADFDTELRRQQQLASTR
jgi:metallo-beta-lactamase class B